VASVAAELGTIDHLVNVVGGAQGVYDSVADLDLADYDRVVNRNLRYVVVTSRQVARPLLAQGRRGSFVNISSTASRGSPMLSAYCAAKAGLEAISRSMALEWGPAGIRVNVVAAGTTRTGDQPEGEEAPTIPLRRRGETREVAAAVTFLLSDLASYTTGLTLTVDGGAALGHPGGSSVSRYSVPKVGG
jgi:NAD(P)-dependent dehydrogenase (short-subunit alcohol dehydrogenase family)